jgi:hypothetical protein
MPVEIQSGKIAQALRGLLDLRGRIPLQMDETVVPMVNAGTADVPGAVIDRTGQGVVGFASAPAVLAQNPVLAFAPLAGQSLNLTMDFVQLVAGAAGAAFTLILRASQADFTAQTGIAFTKFQGQLLEGPLPSTGTGGGPLEIAAGATATPYAGGGGLLNWWTLASSPQSWFNIVPNGILARPGDCIVFQHGLTNVTFNVGFFGRLFPTSR